VIVVVGEVGEGDSLEGESTALDLLAVASGVELLEVGLVLAGDEGIGEPGGLPDSHISSHASNLASDPLHAGLALEDGVVDVVDALNHVVHWVHFFGNISLPSDGGKRNIGGEEEGKADNNEDSDNDEGDIGEESGLLLFVCDGGTVAGSGGTIRGSGLFITGSGGTIGGSWGSVGGSGGSIRGSGGRVASSRCGVSA